MSDTPIKAPTRQELCDEIGFEVVSRELDDDGHRGDDVTAVYYRESDETFWRVCYSVSGDGYINDLDGGEYCNPPEITQVEKTLWTTIRYTPIK